ncbi:hypothetical protein, partial [Streptomyces sodiiphilus]|uniref:hypothetical protein n=1 Tax=Streptomyces sodiiphilus TaxID=226217 RepID=UPI0031CDDFD2
GYTYANNNPLTYSDPTGLFFRNPTKFLNSMKKIAKTATKLYKKSQSVKRSSTATRTSYTSRNASTRTNGPVSDDSVCVGSNSAYCIKYRTTGKYPPSMWGPQDPTVSGRDIAKALVSLFVSLDEWKGCLGDEPNLSDCVWAGTDFVPALKPARAGKFFNKFRNIDCNSFAPGTRVLMADGTAKPIEEVEIG